MNKSVMPVLAKSAPSGGSSAKTYACPFCGKSHHTPNAVTIAALKEGQDIMSGKKKTKTYHSAEELFSDLNT